jgi:hypothetical protein
MFKTATTFDIPKDLYTSPKAQEKLYFFPKNERDAYMPKKPCVGLFCFNVRIPLDGVNLAAESYMNEKDFFKARKKENLINAAL